MKKYLLGTTALVAAGALAGTASAAEPIKIGLGGYYNTYMNYIDQEESAVGQAESVNVVTNGEVCFTGSTKLDNGITVGLNIQLVGNTNADQIDESFITLSSDSLGTLIVGSKDNGVYLFHSGPSVPGVDLQENADQWGTLINGGGGPATLVNETGDAEGITYASPRFFGLQLGGSYIPDTDEDANNTAQAVLNNVWGVAANYDQTFGGLGVRLDGGYVHGNINRGAASNTAVNNDDDADIYSLGARFKYAGFTLDGGYKQSLGGGLNTASTLKKTTWGTGLSYATGPYAVGIGFITSSDQNGAPNTANADFTQKVYVLSGSYNIGPGVDLAGAIFHNEFDAGAGTLPVAGSANRSNGGSGSNDATGVSAGIKLAF